MIKCFYVVLITTLVKEIMTENITDFEDFENLLEEYENSTPCLTEGTIVKGKILEIADKTVTVDIGGKSVGYIALSEFADEEPKVGDEVDVFIERLENKKGELLISRENAKKYQSWNYLKNCLNDSKIVDGKILGKVKGGFAVDLNGVIAFLPRSQVDTIVLADPEQFIGKSEQFMILKIDDVRGNVVVSRRAILEDQRAKEREEILANIKVGDVLEGMVKNLTDYGAFIDFGSFDGLLHLTDISWCRVRHPSEVLKLGQTVKVQVIKYDEETKKVSLGMKQLQENPWETIEKKFPINSITKGKVTNIAQYGVFVEIENGIEGLVHVSEMSWLKNNISPSKYLYLGQEVNVMILDIDTDHHRISLGIKQCEKNPWEEFSNKYLVGDELEGTIKNMTDFGLFVEFPSGVDGLVHVSDLDWNDPEGKEAMKKYKKNETVKVVLLGSNAEQERISLGIKQLSIENFKDKVMALQKGDKVSCVVKNVRKDFIEAEIELGLKGIIKKCDISTDKKEQRTEKFNINDKIDATVFTFDNKTGKLLLTLKGVEESEKTSAEGDDDDDFDIEQYMNPDTGTTLGSVLADVLEEAKNNSNK